MTSDYKKYSLEKLQEWVHDALSCGEASPHEIYSAIREAVQEDYQYYKDHSARAYGLLELLSGHRPVADDELLRAALVEKEYYKSNVRCDVKYDSIEQMLEKHQKLICGKDDPSPECKKSWNDFWEQSYFSGVTDTPEEAEELRSEIEELKKDKVVKWQLPVETDLSGEYFVTFPDDLLEAANLEEGDTVEWVDNGNGSYLLKKVENKPMNYTEMIAAGFTMTDDGFWIKEKV